MAWKVILTERVERWLLTELDQHSRRQIVPAIDELEERGPALGRLFVDTIKQSSHNMKELRSIGDNIRVLFAFDPKRNAILLIGGEKTDSWRKWYEKNIPIADSLYDDGWRKQYEDHQLEGRPSACSQVGGRATYPKN